MVERPLPMAYCQTVKEATWSSGYSDDDVAVSISTSRLGPVLCVESSIFLSDVFTMRGILGQLCQICLAEKVDQSRFLSSQFLTRWCYEELNYLIT